MAGKTEKDGPCGKDFDVIIEDEYSGETTFEQAESRLVATAVETLLNKNRSFGGDIDILFGEICLIGAPAQPSSRKLRDFPCGGVRRLLHHGADIGACRLFCRRGLCKLCGGGDVLPFCASERQFRLPLEYGGQRAGSRNGRSRGREPCWWREAGEKSK